MLPQLAAQTVVFDAAVAGLAAAAARA